MEIGYGTLERLLVALFGLSETQRKALRGRFKYLQRLGGYGSLPDGRGRARYAIDDTLQIVLIFELIDAGCAPTHALRIVQTFWDKASVNLAYAWSDVRNATVGAASEQVLWTVIPKALGELGAKRSMLDVKVAGVPGELTLAGILDWQPGRGVGGTRHAIVVHLPSLLADLLEAFTVVEPAERDAFAASLDDLAAGYGIAIPG